MFRVRGLVLPATGMIVAACLLFGPTPASGAHTGGPHGAVAPDAPGPAAPGRVYEIPVTGPVDPLVAQMVVRGIDRADADPRAAAVLVRLDTPGGLDSSMRRIIGRILASKVPVVCWVGPSGSRAASAGAVVLVGCPVATMAPGTNTGAAHPVGITGDILSRKVTNDAAAYIRSLAERWGRNADWAERAVRESVSISAGEAQRIGVVDLVAPDRAALFAALEGRTVRTASGEITLRLAGVGISKVRLTPGEAILHGVVDPNVAFLFFVLGLAGLVFEFTHPGLNLPGVVGLLLIVAALVILGMLPVNVAALVLLVASMAFFALDLHVAAHGVPTAAGIVTLVVGGMFLFDSSVPSARVSRPLLAAVALGMAAFFFFVLRAAMAARRLPPPAGTDAVIGSDGVVVRALDPSGIVRANGESWTAQAPAGAVVPAGTPVRVVARRGLILEVVPLNPTEVSR